MNRSYLNFCLLSLLLLSCGGRGDTAYRQTLAGYRLQSPDEIMVLPDELEEISGLSALSENLLLCNEDETGSLYIFNIEKEEVEERVEWGAKGDYEGVASKGSTAYVLESNGDIHQLKNFLTAGQEVEVKTYEHNSLKDCDAEGLCFVPGTENLLIACKEGEQTKRSIHAFNTAQQKLQKEIYRQLAFKELEDRLLRTGLDKLSFKLRQLLDPPNKAGIFFPSGIAIHPLTQELYILSAKTRLLAVYTEVGNLKSVHELAHEQFLQPEAIAFTPNGDLYIGNEGKGGEPNILKFIYDPKE